MYIASVPNRRSPPAILLRESYREGGGKVRTRTLANLSSLTAKQIAGMRRALGNSNEEALGPGAAEKVRDRAHGAGECQRSCRFCGSLRVVPSRALARDLVLISLRVEEDRGSGGPVAGAA